MSPGQCGYELQGVRREASDDSVGATDENEVLGQT